jgi:glucose-1-phosphate thymidylyltransferase
MRAIIPVAGFGTRLKPHTFSTPKVLLNVGGKPILGHILDQLIDSKIFNATFIVGYLGDKIKEYVERDFPKINATYVEQKEMLGLGHAIYTAIPTFDDDELFIILGDTVFDVNLHGVFNTKTTSLGVKEVIDPSRFGVALTDNGRITKLIEKPKTLVSKLALVGLYYIANAGLLKDCLVELVEKDIRTNNELQLTDALQLMIDKGEVIKTFPVEGWYDCGKPETLLSTNKFLLDKYGSNKKMKNSLIVDPVFIGENCTIENAIIGPYTTIADNSTIIESIIRNSIISENATVKRAMLDNTLIGNNAVVKGNFKRLNAGDSSEIEFY